VKPLSKAQSKALEQIAHRAPAWFIRAGRITTLEALERIGLIELRLGYLGWEARITEKGLDVIEAMNN